MSKLFKDVQPGDLITANLWNQVLDTLNSFDDRITALETSGTGGGVVTISGLFPPSPLHIGDTVTILGRNFGLPTANTVLINNSPVGQPLPGSNDTQLIIKIPNLQGVPQGGQFVNLSVANATGSATITFLLLPGQPTLPTGSLAVNLSATPVTPPDPVINSGKSYIFTFSVTAITSMDETYTLTPKASQAGWSVVVVDGQGNPLTPAEITIPKSDPPNGSVQTVRVMLVVPPGAPNGTASQLTLTVTSKLNPALTNFGSVPSPVTVGSPPPGGQDQVVVSFNTVFSPGSSSGGVVKIPPTGSQVRVDFTAAIKAQAGTCTVLAPVIQNDPGQLWKAQLMSPQTLSPGSPLVTIALSAQPGAPAATLVIAVRSVSNTQLTGQCPQPIVAG